MVRIGKVIVLGILAGCAGCANLQKSLSLSPRPAPDPLPAKAAEASPSLAGPIDPFHPPAETAATRFSRYFPSLSRFDRSVPATGVPSGTDKQGHLGGNDLNLRALPLPQPEPNFGDRTTSKPPTSRAGRLFVRNVKARPEASPSPLPRVAHSNEPVPEAESMLPLLSASVVAEIDPADVPSPRTVPSPEILPARTPEQEAARMASAALSPRRNPPPLPRIYANERATPPRLPEIAADRREDDQTRLARVQNEDLPPARNERVKPLLDVEEPLPPVEVAKEPDHASEIPARPPVMVEPEPRETPDAPPPIDSPKPEARVEPADPDADADQPLAGRPRLARPSARRDALPPGVPPVSFPKTYYGRDPLHEASEKPQPHGEAKPSIWRPRLLKRLRGEAL